MSGEIGVVVLAPAVVPIALLGVAGWAMGKAADAAIERQRRVQAANARTAGALDRYRALQRRVERARAQFGAEIDPLPDPPGSVSPGGDLALADSIAADLLRRVDAAERRLAAQLGAARSQRIVAALQNAIGGLLAASPAGPAVPAARTALSQQPAELGEALQRVLSRLDAGAPEPVVRRLEAWAEQALRVPSPATARKLLDDLRYSVDKANQAVTRKRERLAGLAGRLREYPGPLIDDALALVAAAEDEPEPDWPGLESAVDAAIERTKAEATRRYIAWALRESLNEVGVEVEADFDVLLSRDGVAHVQHADWADLAVRVRSRPDEQAVHFNLVAPRDGDLELDPAAEAQWCGAFDAVLPVLAERGIEVQVTHRSEEGEAEVQAVDPARFPFERRRRARRDEPKRQERSR